MRKILIISPTFSQNNVIGAVRLRGLAKYLPQWGWEPTILTINPDYRFESPYNVIQLEYEDIKTHWKNKIGISSKKDYTAKDELDLKTSGNIVETNSKNTPSKRKESTLNFLSKYIDEIFYYPDYARYWYEPAVEECSKLLQKGDFDAIFSSSPPATSHLVAKHLNKRFGVPWLADLRDLWTQNPYYRYSFIRKFFERRLELEVLGGADFLTTTSPFSAEDLKGLHKRRDVSPILNGFDSEFNNHNIGLPDKINLTYSGNLYSGKRDPEPLLRALKELDGEGKIDISIFSVDFYSPVKNWLISEVEKYHLQDVVTLHGMISREEILKIQLESQVLLLLSWNDSREKGVIPGKIYEYFGAARPILSIGPPEGLVKDLIEQTQTGIHLSEYESLKKVLVNIYDEFKLNGRIEYKGIPGEINKYSQQEMTKKFVSILEEITK